jgi:RNA polymerase sigma-70 factor (ECF subfamily)
VCIPSPENSSNTSENAFESLLRRVRAGDQDAAAELVRNYEEHVRRVARIRMRDPRLRRSLDSTDISQSVLASFFARAALGQYELKSPDQLVKLLAAMTRNKLASLARMAHVTRRDSRDFEVVAREENRLAPGRAPADEIAGRDLLAAFRARINEQERWLSDQRAQGRDWAAIAEDVGGRPDALRVKLARALDRVSKQLGMWDAVDG